LAANNIELAVNINTLFEPKTFIKQRIISHKGTQASVRKFNGKGYLKEFEHSQYYIKIYDKGFQFNRPKNIFRFEIKVIKMEYLKKIGINTLADLLNIDKLKRLGVLLNSVFNELLIIDKVVAAVLTAKELSIYQNGTNPMFWENLKPNSANYTNINKDAEYKKDRKKYYRELDKFTILVKKYNLNQTQKELSKLIENKWTELLKIDTEIRDKLTVFLSEMKQQKEGQIDRLFKIVENTKKGQNDTSNIVLDCPIIKKKCKVTNLDISMQKDDSIFINVIALKYYQKNKPKIYEELEKRLSNKWETKSIKKQNTEIAHSIRNEYNNKFHNNKRDIEKLMSKPSLFNNYDLIDKKRLRLAGMI